jgi:hypothetical protein
MIAGQLGLAVNGDVAAGQRLDVDAEGLRIGREIETVLNDPLRIEPIGDA